MPPRPRACASAWIVEVVGATKAPCVRVRLDKLEGDPINLDEVTAQTAWVSETVEALDPISSAYTLEVSSPGMKRPLRRPSDFARFVGEDVELTTTAMVGRRSYTGAIAAATDTDVTIQPEGEDSVTIAFDDSTCSIALRPHSPRPMLAFSSSTGARRSPSTAPPARST